MQSFHLFEFNDNNENDIIVKELNINKKKILLKLFRQKGRKDIL